MISERNTKIKQMSGNYEPLARIETYKKESLDRIRSEYQKAIGAMKVQVQADMEAIEKKYWQERPSIEKQAQSITVAGVRYHSMSDKQLREESKKIMTIPAPFIDLEDIRTCASQLRSRGAIEDADKVANFIQSVRLETAYVHYPEYQALQKRSERLKTYEAQKNIFILSSNPDVIKDCDIVHLDNLEKEG